MRKLLTRWMALCLCVVLCMALAACGGKTPEGNVTGQAGTPSTTPEDTDPPQDGGDSNSLETYISNNQSKIDSMISSMTEDGMSIDVTAEGNTLIYNFTFDDGAEEYMETDLDTIKTYLNIGLFSMLPTFNDILKSLKQEVASAESIVVNYLDKDGELLATREYDGSSSSLEDFVTQNQEILDKMLDNAADEDMSISVTAEGNTLVYNLKFETGVEAYFETDMENAKAYLEEISSGLESTFTDILDVLKEVVPSTESIRIDYLDMNGDLVFSWEFT